jgi:hypothetical protein
MLFKVYALRYLEKYIEAIKLLDKIILMKVDYIKTYALKIVVLTKINLLDEGLELVDISILIFGMHQDLFNYRSKILAKLGIYEERDKLYG